MKNVYIIHGWEGSPKEYLHQWLKNQLEKRGFKVVVPKMPDPSAPRIKAWINKIKSLKKNLELILSLNTTKAILLSVII